MHSVGLCNLIKKKNIYVVAKYIICIRFLLYKRMWKKDMLGNNTMFFILIDGIALF